jgi:hypothetical protein
MADRFVEEGRDAAAMQLRWDKRSGARDGAAPYGVNGAPPGTSGAALKVPAFAYASVAFFIAVLLTVNVLTVRQDAGPALAGWKPFVAEYTAGLMILATMPAVAFLTERISPGRGRWLRFALIHVVGAIAFCAVVVGGFVLLRKMIYAAMGLHYLFVPGKEVIYEFRKVALAYAGMVFVFHLTARPRSVASVPTQADAPKAAATFDIQDGQKLIRVPIEEILAVRAAGNYAEFSLLDGRRPLMRSTLASLEDAFRPHGFVRTHRSWIVNPSRLRALEPEGSGDWRILLENETEAPLSRRYAEALAVLRRA